MGAFTELTEPVIALTVELAAIVIIMSLLFLMWVKLFTVSLKLAQPW